MHYNHDVSTVRISKAFILALLATPLLMGGACEKKPDKPIDPGLINALDRGSSDAQTGVGVGKPVDTTPLKDIEVGKLDSDKQQTFYKLVGTLKSPCGKNESLRKSYTDDTSCKRAPFAVRYVTAMLEDEFPEDKIREDYVAKYEKPRLVKLDGREWLAASATLGDLGWVLVVAQPASTAFHAAQLVRTYTLFWAAISLLLTLVLGLVLARGLAGRRSSMATPRRWTGRAPPTTPNSPPPIPRRRSS